MLKAGSSEVIITPEKTQFLYGYPHVERYSTGVDTNLFSSALFLESKEKRLLMIANDLVYMSKQSIAEIRAGIAESTGISAQNIMLTCTHTHSGPVTADRIGRKADPIVPPPDESYLKWMIEKVVDNAVKAVSKSEKAELGLEFADSSEVGGNRRDPNGPANPKVPTMLIRRLADHTPIALMMLVCVHPTVLHEDCKLVSADFPGYARSRIQSKLGSIPVIYHTGPAGNQSPRHHTLENTPAEAKRLGEILAASVLETLNNIDFSSRINLDSGFEEVVLPINEFPRVSTARKREREVRERLSDLRKAEADPKQIRTAECDWFGAERRLVLSELMESGELNSLVQQRLPAEIQVFRVGPWRFIAWPGEIFVEFGLELMNQVPKAFAIAYANGETQGYLVTAKAASEGGYEAGTAIFKSPESPEILLKTTLDLINKPRLKRSFRTPS